MDLINALLEIVRRLSLAVKEISLIKNLFQNNMKRQTTLKEYWTWSEEEDAGDNLGLELSNNDEVGE